MAKHFFHTDGTLPPPGPDGQWVFVFGSNLAGRHGAGAAKVAKTRFGAQFGIGRGRTGNAYAIPTKNEHLSSLRLDQIEKFVKEFVDYAREHESALFFVTRVGCGLAGYLDEQIAPLFQAAPTNCSLPLDWKPFVGAATLVAPLPELAPED